MECNQIPLTFSKLYKTSDKFILIVTKSGRIVLYYYPGSCNAMRYVMDSEYVIF